MAISQAITAAARDGVLAGIAIHVAEMDRRKRDAATSRRVMEIICAPSDPLDPENDEQMLEAARRDLMEARRRRETGSPSPVRAQRLPSVSRNAAIAVGLTSLLLRGHSRNAQIASAMMPIAARSILRSFPFSMVCVTATMVGAALVVRKLRASRHSRRDA